MNDIKASESFFDIGYDKSCAIVAMLCDFNYSTAAQSERFTSLACFASGKAELYSSKSGLKTGAIHRLGTIEREVMGLIKKSENAIYLFKKTDDYYLPEAESARIYAITTAGVFIVEYNLNFIWTLNYQLSEIQKQIEIIAHMIRSSSVKQIELHT